jgi:uncharacterized protein (UPF0261 family)
VNTILIVSALDTKGVEVLFLREQIESLGARATVIDAGILGKPYFTPEVTREEVARLAGLTLEEIRNIPSEGEAMEVMIKGAINKTQALFAEGKIQGVLSVGGTMGTALGTAVMRSLPYGVPKVMVSTVAGVGDVSVYVGTKDIIMYHSVADVAGLNRLTRKIFSSAAAAVVGMSNVPQDDTVNKRLVAVSTLGTTEAAASNVRSRLAEKGFETITFHTTGVGGTCLEQLMAEGVVDGGVVELSLHEWVDRIAGGLFQPPDDRYENAGKRGLPQLYVPGSTDFIVHRAGQEKFQGRKTHMHNRAITLYRTSREEFTTVGKEVALKFNKSLGPVTVLIPLKGFCVHDREGGPLYDPEANMGFVEALEANIQPNVTVKKVDAHVLDDYFVDAVINSFMEMSQRVMALEKAKQRK